MSLTSLTGPIPVTGSGAVTDEAIPTFLAYAVVFAGVAVTLFSCYFAAGSLNARPVLGFCDLLDVLTASINEEIADAAHVAIVQHSGPKLGGKHQAEQVVRETSEIQVTLKVQNLILSSGSKRCPTAVHGNNTCSKQQQAIRNGASLEKMFYSCCQLRYASNIIHA